MEGLAFHNWKGLASNAVRIGYFGGWAHETQTTFAGSFFVVKRNYQVKAYIAYTSRT